MYVKQMISGALQVALAECSVQQSWPASLQPREWVRRQPAGSKWGDYASTVAMQIADRIGTSPTEAAQLICDSLRNHVWLEAAEVVRPGFINLHLKDSWLSGYLMGIQSEAAYGHLNIGQGRKVQVEFVSANPTGPLHFGSGRNAAIGDAIARVLAISGYQVAREYYVNDSGTQMDIFAETLYALYAQHAGKDVALPPGGYEGEYMAEIAAHAYAKFGDSLLALPQADALVGLQTFGLDTVLEMIRASLERIGVSFDRWFSERQIYTSGLWDQVFQMLKQGGYTDDHDGAVWFKTGSINEQEKDSVLVRSDGRPGYFASDIAYHFNKFIIRNFEWVINVWGADHHGHVPRMMAMMQSLGLDPEQLTIVLYQLVTLTRAGEVVRLSKRKGNFITLDEVVAEIGSDAFRYYMLSRSSDSQMEIDLEAAAAASAENPVYYVQYAHARAASILEKIQILGDRRRDQDSNYEDDSEHALALQLIAFPEVVEIAATRLAPHVIVEYCLETAQRFNQFYKNCRVVEFGEESAVVSQGRAALVTATRNVLGQGLSLLGITAPTHM